MLIIPRCRFADVDISGDAMPNKTATAIIDEPVSERGSLIEQLISVSKASRCLSGYQLAELGLFAGQDEMLLLLKEDASMSVTELAENLGIRPSTASKMIDRLVSGGLVSRARDPDDSRAMRIFITALGVNLKNEVMRQHERLEADFTKAYGAEGAGQIAEALSTMKDIVQRRLLRVR